MISYVCMCADILHKGHINILKTANLYGKVLVGLMTDDVMVSYKRKPYLSYGDRKAVLENIDKVKGIVCFSIFQFPLDNKIRNNMFNKIIKKKKFIDFALEEISIKKKVDILNVNELATIRYEDEIKKK